MVSTDYGMCCAFNLDKADKLFKSDSHDVQQMVELNRDLRQSFDVYKEDQNVGIDSKRFGELPENWGREGEEPIPKVSRVSFDLYFSSN